MSIDCIIQARLGSTRLPGKVLKEIEGKPLIYYCLNQVSHSKMINRIIVASTTSPKDKLLIDSVKKLGFNVFAGSEDDVLDRYYQTAKHYGSKIIVRITADSPLIDPEVIDLVIQEFQKDICDYCSNVQPPTYPDGLDVEVFSFEALKRAWRDAKWMSEREHVTVHFWKNPEKFKIRNVENNINLSNFRLTVDEIEDFKLVNQIIKKIKKSPIFLRDVMDLFKENPDLLKINSRFMRNEGQAKSFKIDKIVK